MSRRKYLSSERIVATTLVLFASSIGGMAGCEVISQVDRSTITGGAGGEGGTGGGGMAGMGGTGGAMCVPVDDQNDCTTDICENGMPVNKPVTVGTACATNGGSLCDDTGACVECLAASDCPGTDDACQTRTCVMGACGFDYTAADTPIPTQTMGDCKVTVCDGAGKQVDNNDDLDVPDDSNACTDDVCTAGVPSNVPLPHGTNCGMNGNGDPLVCNDLAQCVGCNTGADCPGTDDECSTRTCTNNVCGVSFTAKDTAVAAQTDNDCLLHVCDGNGNFVDIADDTDLPLDDGNACTSETCSAGMPGHPAVMNGAACSDGNACTPMDTCQMGTCTAGTAITCTASDQCHIAGTCDPMSGTCSNPPANDGTACNDGNLCTQTDACLAGTCTGSNPVSCVAADQCHIAGTCDSTTGMCSNPPATDGTACNDGNPCTQTDSCTAGACTGSNPVSCMASDQCHIAGMCDSTTGTCTNPTANDGTACVSNTVTGACTAGTCIACGDGILAGTEACDDGNTTPGDGCNATCGVETGFACTGSPSACAPICGDGLIRGAEQCDDKNTTSGDGCSSACMLDISCGAGEQMVIVTNNTSTAIPDTYTGVISSINVGQTGVVRKVISTINITHPKTGDLDIFLSSPYGTQRVLVNDVGTAANFTATTFSDAATTAIGSGTAPYTGTFKSVETLSDAAGFANQTATGNWVLRVSDDTPTNTGTINSWSVALCVDPSVPSVCGNGFVEPNEQCDDGNAVSGDGCNNCQIEITCAGNETKVIQKSTNAALLIPDNTAAGVSSTIAISNTGNISKAVAVVNAISHQFDGDVSITLTSPVGTALDLSSLNGSAGDNYASTLFDDAAATAITAGTAPYRGRYKPEVALSGVTGQAPNGTWTLNVKDTANIDAGLFGTWSLGLCIAPPAVCGNGTQELGEGCDDGNTTANDGCSAACAVEQGYTCTGTAPSTCSFTCGNGTVTGSEQCDDGNTTNGDLCSSVCLWEFTPETEPNNACGATNGPYTIPFIYSGAITPVGDQDFISFTIPAYADITLETFAPDMNVCPTGNDTVIDLRGSDCTTVLVSDDEGGINSCSKIDPVTYSGARNLAPGTYYAHVEDYLNNGVIAAYKLKVSYNALCGDGLITGSETCDDGNTAGGDGCAANCRTEPGYGCTGQPSTCVFACGDGTVSGSEQCDDGNSNNGDGCNSVCNVEQGYTCTGGGAGSCTFTCGNGSVSGTEQCDDGNTTNGDGCSSVCLWEITPESEPNSVCGTTNGPLTPPFILDGSISPIGDLDFVAVNVPNYADLKIQTFAPTLGVCTSGNDTVIELRGTNCTSTLTTNDEGGIPSCSLIDPATNAAARHLAPGTYYVVARDYLNDGVIPSYKLQVTFAALCGNGIKEGSEACDGGPTCAADCTLLPICGNNSVETGEQCDDGNTTNGDGCNATCQWESTAEVEPNNTTADADVSTVQIANTINITGGLTAADKDIFKVNVTAANTVVRFETFDSTGHDCVAMTATRLTLFDNVGTQLKQDTVSAGIGNCSELAVLLQPGTYYIQVDNSAGTAVPSYFLRTVFHTNNGNEVEPNDTQATATTDPGFNTQIFGDHQVSTDTDWYSVTVPQGTSLRIETIEGDASETCESNGIDSTIALFNAAGTQLTSDGDTGRGYCSQIDGTGATPSNSGAHNLAAGTYFIKVTSFNTTAANGNQFNYRLVTVVR